MSSPLTSPVVSPLATHVHLQEVPSTALTQVHAQPPTSTQWGFSNSLLTIYLPDCSLYPKLGITPTSIILQNSSNSTSHLLEHPSCLPTSNPKSLPRGPVWPWRKESCTNGTNLCSHVPCQRWILPMNKIKTPHSGSPFPTTHKKPIQLWRSFQRFFPSQSLHIRSQRETIFSPKDHKGPSWKLPDAASYNGAI